ncbi:MAG: ribosomal-processing cysteine protease Prp [Thermovenabulum sp.]|uniref:ribosomal-processing cysteine protease Prp n=1 Tax=Thermovenabulum sp. TaxID=3100335 RepID=UPI003C7C009D
MVKITVWKDKEGSITKLEIKGHAGYADYGKDIICAAVSALGETAILGIEKIALINTNSTKKEGYLSIEIPKDISKESRYKADIILQTTAMGLEDIAKTYPKYVNFVCREEH